MYAKMTALCWADLVQTIGLRVVGTERVRLQNPRAHHDARDAELCREALRCVDGRALPRDGYRGVASGSCQSRRLQGGVYETWLRGDDRERDPHARRQNRYWAVRRRPIPSLRRQ